MPWIRRARLIRGKYGIEVRTSSIDAFTGRFHESESSGAGRRVQSKSTPCCWHRLPGVIKALKITSCVGKLVRFVAAIDTMPFIDPKLEVVIFAAASLLKDTVNRVGDLVDDGQPTQSFKI